MVYRGTCNAVKQSMEGSCMYCDYQNAKKIGKESSNQLGKMYWNVRLNNVNFCESTISFRVTVYRTAFKKTSLSSTRFPYINELFHKLTLRCN